MIVGRLARSAAPAGTADETGNGRLDLARAAGDTGTGEISRPASWGPRTAGPSSDRTSRPPSRTWTGGGGNNNWRNGSQLGRDGARTE